MVIRFKKHWLLILFCLFSVVISQRFHSTNDTQVKDLLIKDNGIKQAFFPSTHNIRKILTCLIKNEQKRIKLAIFLLTDKHIANALIEAKKNNNIQIDVITCHSNLTNHYNKINLLSQNNINCYIFKPNNKNAKKAAIMHNKFFIFEKNINNKSILITGSLNCTAKAQDINKENILVLDDAYLVNLYNKEFEDIKMKSKLLVTKPTMFKDKKENSLIDDFKKSFRLLVN